MSKMPYIEVKEPPKNDDTFALDDDTKQPGRHYRWVKEDPRRIARHKMRGYRVELAGEDSVRPMLEGDDSGDGKIRNGDSILMSCDEEAYRGRKRAQDELTLSRTRQPAKEVKRAAKKKGIRTFVRQPNEVGDDD